MVRQALFLKLSLWLLRVFRQSDSNLPLSSNRPWSKSVQDIKASFISFNQTILNVTFEVFQIRSSSTCWKNQLGLALMTIQDFQSKIKETLRDYIQLQHLLSAWYSQCIGFNWLLLPRMELSVKSLKTTSSTICYTVVCLSAPTLCCFWWVEQDNLLSKSVPIQQSPYQVILKLTSWIII